MEDVPFTREQILLFARYEFHHGKPVEEAFKSFCKILGENAMEYHEFEYWHYRFKDGQFDLDHDRSKDPKKPGLVDIPLEVVEMIIGRLTLEEKLSLRNVSQGLRETVDNMKYSVWGFWLFLPDKYGHSLEFANEKVNFKNWKQALKAFVIMMNWPRMKVELLDIDIDLNEQDTTHVLEAFKSFNRQIPLTELYIFPQHVDAVFAVLPYLQPKFLESIYINFEFSDGYINLDEVVKLDQWKQAKVLHAYHAVLPFESLYHAEEINIFVRNMSIDDVVKLKNALFASPNFKKCYVTVEDENDERAIFAAFKNEIITIPETNQLFVIVFGYKCSFKFKKTTA